MTGEQGAVEGRLRVLYICYLSLGDPLVHSQVVAYLAGLADRGHAIHLLTFEPRGVSRSTRRRWRRELAERGIAWHRLRYHTAPSLPATVFDVVCGSVLGFALIKRHRLEAVHARSHVPAAVGLALQTLTGARLLFDIRGLMAEEYVDAGTWSAGGIPFRLTKWIERKAISRASGIVVLTNRLREWLFGAEEEAPCITVIPCCVDTECIERQRPNRDMVRTSLGAGDRTVLVYVGKFGGWYMESAMVDFFVAARESSDDLFFLVLSQSDHELIATQFRRRGVSSEHYAIRSVMPDEVGSYLSASDIALSFIRPAPSKMSSSPTKIAEYLAAGLPVIATQGVGDTDALFESADVGALVNQHRPEAYRVALQHVRGLLADPDHPRRARRVVDEYLSLEHVGIPRYDALYRRVSHSGLGDERESEGAPGRSTIEIRP